LVILSLLILISSLYVSDAFAEKIIFSEGKEYELGEILEETFSRLTQFTKIHGLTTTGEMFFTFTSPNFEYVMFLDRTGNWQKAELRDKIVETVEPTNPVITEEKIELHYLLDQYERVFSRDDYKFFVKTFDKSIYSGTDFQSFQGTISGAKVSAIITDPNGAVKADFQGVVEYGEYEGVVYVTENLWQQGWYVTDLVIEFEGKFYHEQLTFYVFAAPPSSSSGCGAGKTLENGICV